MATNDNPFQDPSDMDIADLRRMCAVMKIPTEKSWDKSKYVDAINRNRKSRTLAKLVLDLKEDIPPGFVRIKILKDSSGSDSPVPVNINRFKTRIPRDQVVDVPKEVVEVLDNSTEIVTRAVLDRDGKEVISTVRVPAYNYQKLGESFGESSAVRPLIDPAKQTVREQFRKIFHKWPTRAQQREFEAVMMKRAAEEAGLFDKSVLDAAGKAAGASDNEAE